MKKTFLFLFSTAALIFDAQITQRPKNWFNLDPTLDSVNGVSTERAYKELLKDKKSTTVIVGVIDSGVDYEHEDLKNVMWVNANEIANNGIDDDKNGYIDDIHGWNFIGGKDGKNVEKDNLELTRVYKDLKNKYGNKTEKDLSSEKIKKEYNYYLTVKADYEKELGDAESQSKQYKIIREAIAGVEEKIKKENGNKKITIEDLTKFEAKDKQEKQGKMIAINQLKSGTEIDELLNQIDEAIKSMTSSHLDLENNSRLIVGDDYNNINEKYYGNADCKGPGAFHGTHVSGIIAASRNNGIGIDGIADNVRIMSIRCVPDGDERDKDIANGIIYAVNNGALIINMSFGKKYSPGKNAVDKAVKYAEKKGVLIVHAAGNASENIDTIIHYPCKKLENGTTPSNFIDIGALSWQANQKIVAPFSNYGKNTVDVFAPGVDIYSTVPDLNQYKDASGTSMAAPVVVGVATVLKSYYPKLTPKQIIKIINDSSNKKYMSTKVLKPGTNEEVEFGELSLTGGIVNLYEALKLAASY